MSPTSRELNGTRLTSLKIHKDSHLIQKPSSSSSSSSPSSLTIATTQQQQQRHHHPVIIYTHSPKVIHTQASDFMALVQKLTGLSHSNNDDTNGKDNSNVEKAVTFGYDDSSSSSENSAVGESHLPTTAMLPLGFDPLPATHFMQEIPLFTPSSSEFFCPTTSFYSYPDSSVLSPPNPNTGSPLLFAAMNAFPEI